jgi:predicted nuclease with TOPRIM domain
VFSFLGDGTMKIHADVLAAHAQFGGDLETMQRCYEWYDLKSEIESLRSRAEKAEAELSRRTANPADYRYWEGRYRDEKADNERLEAACEKLAAALERLCDYSNAEYVPNILFELASDALSAYRKEASE